MQSLHDADKLQLCKCTTAQMYVQYAYNSDYPIKQVSTKIIKSWDTEKKL